MNDRKAHTRYSHTLVLLVLFMLFFTGLQGTSDLPDYAGDETAAFIVQGTDLSSVMTAVNRVGGEITSQLDIINAIGANLNSTQKAALAQAPGILRIWPDNSVQTADSADPGTIFTPIAGVETGSTTFQYNRIYRCNDRREPLGTLSIDNSLLSHYHQGYLFTPAVNPEQLPENTSLHLLFLEKDLTDIVVNVYQASTGIWHPFEIQPSRVNNRLSYVDLNLTSILTTPADYNQIQVRFAANGERRSKAEMDCLWLELDGGIQEKPVTGYEAEIVPFDLSKVQMQDGATEKMDDIPTDVEMHTGFYQTYTFAPTFNPENFPRLIDLQFSFRESELTMARLEVFQASTGAWHTYDIPDIHQTDNEIIHTVIDVTDALQVAADLQNVQVRFVMQQANNGGKAEVDFVGLRLANLVGEATTADISSSFLAIKTDDVWASGNIGQAVGIAILDTGSKRYRELENDSKGQKTSYINGYNVLTGGNNPNDKNGHGTMVSSIISNSKKKRGTTNLYYGAAPDSVIIPVQVLDKDGRGSYTDIIAGIQWVIENKDTYNIRVMNMSLSATPQSYYWDDPLNQAVMRAWQAGIVVVVSAGNGGPNPMSIGVPGNVPYVITVGAFTDAYTPDDWSDDYIPAFSAAGPTYEGFVKPDVIAPGGHVLGLMSEKSELAQANPEYKIDKDYYQMSGTSMSAAQVSGVVALMLTAHPELTPDDVKCRLMSTAVPAVNTDGTLAYSIFQQGTGRVDAYAAVNSSASGCANNGLNIASDLDGSQHYMGKANRDADGNYYIVDEAGWAWSGGWAWSEGWAWSGGWAWSEGWAWSGGWAWSEGWAWSGGWAWSEGWAWSGSWAWSESSAVTSVWLPED